MRMQGFAAVTLLKPIIRGTTDEEVYILPIADRERLPGPYISPIGGIARQMTPRPAFDVTHSGIP
jgi:hypothetical protein